MPDMPRAILFAFGPHSSYAFFCNDELIHENCSWAFKAVVPAKLTRPYYISLGPGEDEYCALYETKENQQWMSVNYPSTPSLKTLEAFFKDNGMETPSFISNVGLVTAPDGTYVACGSRISTAFEYCPAGLKDALLERIDKKDMSINCGQTYYSSSGGISCHPVQMSVGMHGTWFVKWQDGLCSWDLGSEKASMASSSDGKSLYQRLRLLLGHDSSKTAPLELRKSIEYLVLDTWSTQYWFCVLDNGSRVECALPDRIVRKISPTLNAYIRGQQPASAIVSTADRRFSAGIGMAAVNDRPPAYDEAAESSRRKSATGFWKRFTGSGG